MFEPWMLAAIDSAGYNGIRDEHINRVADEIYNTGFSETDRETFEYVCRRAGADSDLFDDFNEQFVNIFCGDTVRKKHISVLVHSVD